MLPLGDPIELDSGRHYEDKQMWSDPLRPQRKGSKVLQEDRIPWLNRSVNEALQRLEKDPISTFPEKLS
jgi:hypothetical protein